MRRPQCLAVAVAALALAWAVGAADFDPGEVPSWVDMKKQRPTSQEDLDNNYRDVARMDAAGQAYDLVQWGDSLTADIRDDRKKNGWDALFEGLLAQPLGMGGSTVEELAFRMVKGGERPAQDPNAVVLWVGLNNAKYRPESDPADKLDWLLQWLQHAMPDTKLAVSALIPNDVISVEGFNAQLAEVAANRSALFFDCGGDLDPNSDQYVDGTHLARSGQRVWLECMREAVDELL